MFLMLASDLVALMMQSHPTWFNRQETAGQLPGLVMALVASGWVVLPLVIGGSLWDSTDVPRIGWVYFFCRCAFLRDYTRKSAPYGRLARMLGLTHFQSGFKIWHLDVTAENGQGATVTLVIKATEAIMSQEFCSAVHATFEVFNSLLKAKLAEEGNHLSDLYGFTPTQTGLAVEVQKPNFIPPPQPVPAPAPA
jgi:hypothetical protein